MNLTICPHNMLMLSRRLLELLDLSFNYFGTEPSVEAVISLPRLLTVMLLLLVGVELEQSFDLFRSCFMYLLHLFSQIRTLLVLLLASEIALDFGFAKQFLYFLLIELNSFHDHHIFRLLFSIK